MRLERMYTISYSFWEIILYRITFLLISNFNYFQTITDNHKKIFIFMILFVNNSHIGQPCSHNYQFSTFCFVFRFRSESKSDMKLTNKPNNIRKYESSYLFIYNARQVNIVLLIEEFGK